LDATIKIFKQHGFKGLHRGQGPTTIRESTGLCLYFTVIEKLTAELTPPNVAKSDVPIYVPIIAGGIGGTSYWMFNYPFDYVKTLMQSDKFGEFKYKNMAQCFSEQFKQNGWRTFFKGYVICMMRSFPVNAAAITVYRFMQNVTGAKSH
jgi:solute carrier family 25 carnitine/acylcarnitine transporter 20/29